MDAAKTGSRSFILLDTNISFDSETAQLLKSGMRPNTNTACQYLNNTEYMFLTIIITSVTGSHLSTLSCVTIHELLVSVGLLELAGNVEAVLGGDSFPVHCSMIP